ncbi:MAG TPA: RICIN domain-containing protein [Solirubrobacteraceae bacterium]|nr:RICIN domain-containing protein [Solirubrobacteraceae bacterium]
MITAFGTSSRWLGTDTSDGYAVYRGVTSDVCLTGRQSLQGFNVVTIEKCIPGSLQQQWRLGAARDFQLRLNGLSAQVNLANPNRPLRMAVFTGQAHQKFRITAL